MLVAAKQLVIRGMEAQAYLGSTICDAAFITPDRDEDGGRCETGRDKFTDPVDDYV
jgi:hypothetical protein